MVVVGGWRWWAFLDCDELSPSVENGMLTFCTRRTSVCCFVCGSVHFSLCANKIAMNRVM